MKILLSFCSEHIFRCLKSLPIEQLHNTPTWLFVLCLVGLKIFSDPFRFSMWNYSSPLLFLSPALTFLLTFNVRERWNQLPTEMLLNHVHLTLNPASEEVRSLWTYFISEVMSQQHSLVMSTCCTHEEFILQRGFSSGSLQTLKMKVFEK